MFKEIFFTLAVLLVASKATPLEISSSYGHQRIHFYVYNRDNPTNPVTLQPTTESLLTSSVLIRPKTAIIVHGHKANGFNSLNPMLRDNFLATEDVNVIVVDWSAYAGQSYSKAVADVPNVGLAIADFVRILKNMNQVSFDRIHLIGFDLGAHIVGFTGRALNGEVARITGLDPAGSKWGRRTPRLNKSDAVYVEVIHTDGSGVLANGIGTELGDADFYVNGGSNQPGCLTHSCSHDRAWELFAASLESGHLIGKRCTLSTQVSLNLCLGDKLFLGGNNLNKKGSGVFRVNTGKKYPF